LFPKGAVIPRILGIDDNVEDYTDEEPDAAPGTDINAEASAAKIEPELLWNPLYAITSWKDPDTKENIVSVAILLPTGVGEQTNDLIIRIENERTLRIGVMWPRALSISEVLNRKWLTGNGVDSITSYHPRVMGFANFVERFQSKEGDPVFSWCSIDLPMPVKPDFTKHLIGFKNSKAIALYIDLMAPDRNFATKTEEFTVQVI